MSVIRLSVRDEKIYAPTPSGEIDKRFYSKRRHTGLLDQMPRDNIVRARGSNFHHYMDWSIASQASSLRPGQPVVVMVHGFMFDPENALPPAGSPHETDNPHGRVYHFNVARNAEELALEQRHHTTGWLGRLGFADGDAGRDGLVIALGWHSNPGFFTSLFAGGKNFYARAYDKADLAAWVLVNVLHLLGHHETLRDHPIDLFCHSLGGRVVVRALSLAAHLGHAEMVGRIGRVLILGGSEYVLDARLMKRRLTDAGFPDQPDVYNFVSRENDVLDKMAENFGPGSAGQHQVIGHNGLEVEDPVDGWIDLQVDSRKLQIWMDNNHSLSIAGDRPWNVWDHWFYFTHPGNMTMYGGILRRRLSGRPPDPLAIGSLRASGVPEGVEKTFWTLGD